MASVREIAKRCGVSPSTVSRVLSNSTPVRDETRTKVLAAINDYSSTQDPNPRITVGIIMPADSAGDLSSHPAMFTIITSFVSALSSMGIANTTLIYNENDGIEFLTAHDDCSAYMIIGTSEKQEDSILKQLHSRTAPYLLINRWVQDERASTINYDDEAVSIKAVEHFLKLGHKKIGFIGGDEDYRNTKLRLSGYLTALKRANLPVQDKYIMFGNYTEASGRATGEKVLSLDDRPTAIYIASDPVAIGCIQCFQDHGVLVPQDIAIIGFGDISACTYVNPTLSTISQSSKETGIMAANTIQQLINNPKISRIQMVMKTELVLRESSGRPILN